MSKVQQIDKALGRYYKNLGVDNYFNEDGIGKFQAWCDDNGFDDEGVNDEFNENPSDCTIIDFDENFPLRNKTNDETETAQQIINIIQQCYNDASAFSSKFTKIFPQMSKNFFDIDSTKDIEEVKQIYSNQCAAIFDTQMLYDRDILKLIAVGLKHDISYLQHLADMYSRDRILYDIQNKIYKNKKVGQYPPLSENIWSAQGNSKFFDSIRNTNNKQHAISTLSAITSFYKRLVPKLLLNESTRIQDLIAPTAKYITSAVLWISRLAQNNIDTVDGNNCPFQIDVCIGYKKVIGSNIYVGATIYDQQEEQKEKEPSFFDCIGNIEDKLKKNNLYYYTQIVDESKQKFGIGSSQRVFQKVFDRYQRGLKRDNYPHKRRFVVFIDRRYVGTGKPDTITMFEPPYNCKCVPDECESMWYLSASRSCIIPNMEYNGDVLDAVNAVSYKIIEQIKNQDLKNGHKKENVKYSVTFVAVTEKKVMNNGLCFMLVVQVDRRYYKINVLRTNEPIKYVLEGKCERDNEFKECDLVNLTTKQKLTQQNIKSNDHCKGGLLTLSFHVIQQDEIKIYLYINGQMCRFMPEDIQYILAKFFDPNYDSGRNSGWTECNEVKTLVRTMKEKGKICDVEFDAFYKKYKSDIKNIKQKNDDFLTLK
eukprot:544177_1